MKSLNYLHKFVFIVLFMSVLFTGCEQLTGTEDDPEQLGSSKSILAFYFTNPAAIGVIDQSTYTIKVKVPVGTDISSLTPTIIHNGTSINYADGTAQDFTNPVIFTVTAADNSSQGYVVIVTESDNLSSEKAITSFTFTNPEAEGVIEESSHTIAVTVPSGTDTSSLIPNIIHTGVSINYITGTVQNYTNPVIYIVTAEDNSTQEYIVTVKKAVALSSDKTITSFSFDSLSVTGTIDNNNYTIEADVAAGSDISNLVPTIIHTGQSINPASGTAQNFSSTVEYTVTAEDNSKQSYNVFVNIFDAVVNFDTDEGTSIPSQRIKAGEKAAYPAIPVKAGYGFGRWYKDPGYSELWDFDNDTVSADMTLYAKWYTATTGLSYSLINDDTEYEVKKGTAGNNSIINIPDYWNGKAVTTIGNEGFDSCSSLITINIPDTVKYIGFSSLSCCNFTSISLPQNLITIEGYAFAFCEKLENINIPDNINIFKEAVFGGCTSLESIIIPEGVTKIENEVFALCENLKTMKMNPANPPDLGTDVFNGVSGCTLHIPTGSSAFSISPYRPEDGIFNKVIDDL